MSSLGFLFFKYTNIGHTQFPMPINYSVIFKIFKAMKFSFLYFRNIKHAQKVHDEL